MPPSPPMMAHLLSLGTQSKDAAQALKTEWYICVCALVLCVRVTESERQQDRDRKKEVLSLAISAARLSICVCQPVFVTGAPGFVLASERVFIHISAGRRIACQSTSARETRLPACLPCNINNRRCHNPNLTSPQPASEQHRWYMGTSGLPLCYRFSA